MRNPDNSTKSSRRSFMKKSVVAAVAAGNLSIFSGLVNASEKHSSEIEDQTNSMCDPHVEELLDEEGKWFGYRCSFKKILDETGHYCDAVCYEEIAPGTWRRRVIDCVNNVGDLNAVTCDSLGDPVI